MFKGWQVRKQGLLEGQRRDHEIIHRLRTQHAIKLQEAWRSARFYRAGKAMRQKVAHCASKINKMYVYWKEREATRSLVVQKRFLSNPLICVAFRRSIYTRTLAVEMLKYRRWALNRLRRLQTSYRAFRIRCMVYEGGVRYRQKEAAARRFQAVWYRYQFQQMRHAARVLQRNIRGWLARLHVAELRRQKWRAKKDWEVSGHSPFAVL